MLTLEAVSYRYAGAVAASLVAIDLELADGEVVGVVGGNDAGKSTLCLVLAGLAPRVIGGTLRGRVLLDGADAADLEMHEMVGRVGIGFQNPSTQMSGVARTVYEEVAFGPSNLGLDRRAVIEQTEAAIEAFGLGGLVERDPERLSGGQQQLVAIASILAMRPRHVILDEPTAQLDPAGTALVGDAIAALAAGGASIVIVEHKTDLLARVANRVVVLDGGAVALAGPAGEVLGRPELADLGVASPGPVRLRRRLAEAGLSGRVPDEALAP
jgi:energy-coupling factor transporter ATP-binding protein EcfA2